MTPPDVGLHAWIDATAGLAGDMLLAALIDAGAPLEAVSNAVSTVTADSVDLVATVVSRAGLRATKIDVVSVAQDQPDRSWADIRTLLAQADLPDLIRERASAGVPAACRGRRSSARDTGKRGPLPRSRELGFDR